MELEQAKRSIGQPFILIGLGITRWDVIRTVSNDGIIEGDLYIASCTDCRVKQEQPEHLRKDNLHIKQQSNNPQLPLL